MKLIVFALATIVVSGHAFAHAEDYTYDEDVSTAKTNGKLVATLEKFRQIMRTGNSSLGLPILDPFQSIQQLINLNKPGLIKLDAVLTNVRVDGLSLYKINTGDFSVIGLKVKLDLSWPEIILKTGYAADGTLGNTLNVFGAGDISAIVRHFNFATDLSLSVKNKRMYVRTIKSKIFLGSLNLKMTGLFDDSELSELLSAAISDMAPQVVKDYQNKIVAFVDKEISNQINNFLKDKSLKDLLAMLG